MAVCETKKSMDAGQFAWSRKNVRHVCDGGFGRRVMYLETVASEILMPSFMSSPRTRGAPQRGFSRLKRRIGSRTSHGLVDGVHGHRQVLTFAERVGEPVIDVLDVIFLHHFEHFLGIGQVSRFPVFDV